jgi:hypothetical protein
MQSGYGYGGWRQWYLGVVCKKYGRVGSGHKIVLKASVRVVVCCEIAIAAVDDPAAGLFPGSALFCICDRLNGVVSR